MGKKFAGKSGIVQLMDDLGAALNENPDMIFMGGGNPGRLLEVEAIFQARLEAVMRDPKERHRLFDIYQSPRGDMGFREQVARFLKQQFGWALSARNNAA
jgi:valine--pyruvate aminotransferase